MTAKSETVGVVVPYSPRIVQTFKEATVAFRADPDGKWILRGDHESALAELKDQALADVTGKLKAELAQRKAERELQSLISGLGALAGELDLQKFNYAAARIRALIPAAANTESEEGHGVG